MDPYEIRAEIDERRTSLSASERTKLSRLVCEHLIRWKPPWSGGGYKGLSVALFRANYKEPILKPIEVYLLKAGAKLFYPRIESLNQGKMEMHFVSNPAKYKWRQQRGLKIEEPGPKAKRVDPKDIDLILVPGFAFNRKGDRLGSGFGFYDRYLARGVRAVRVGVCFEFQLRDGLPIEAWDQPVHFIVTDREIFETKRVT